MAYRLIVKRGMTLSYVTLLFLPGCILERTELLVHKISSSYPVLVQNSNRIVHSSKSDRPCITIWIHGTRFFPASIFKTIYQRQPGLKPKNMFTRQSKLGRIAHALYETYHCHQPPGDVYLFGWSGKLSFGTRARAGTILFNQIDTLVAEMIEIHQSMPSIRIIAHSHGGNVALHMAEYIENRSNNWSIDELVLLACPVQGKTMHNVHNKLFKSIYSLYSSTDLIQILDPQWLFDRNNASSFFSKRDFPHDKKLSQVRITIDSHSLMHSHFSHEYIVRLLPMIINEIQLWEQSQPCGLMLWWYPSKKLLSIYTNGRKIHPERYIQKNLKKLRRFAQRVPLKRLNFNA